jgi:hypothetical protein
VSSGTFTSGELGISVSISSGVVADAPSDEFEFALRVKSRFGGLLFAFEPLSRDLELDTVRAMESDLLRGPPTNVVCPSALDEYVVRISAGLADVEELETSDCRHIVVAFVRTCRDNGTVILVSASRDLEGPPKDWFDAVRVADHSPACAYLQALASL